MKTHKDLLVWQKSIELVTTLYKLTKDFPKEEIYGLTSQIRRSAVSVPSNIAEGAGRHSKKEYTQFLYISLGSLSELETQIIIASNLGYVKQNEIEDLSIEINSLLKMLTSLIRSISEQVNK
ncbi:MAG: four helix bundle protein [Bacteroidota bacterium]